MLKHEIQDEIQGISENTPPNVVKI